MSVSISSVARQFGVRASALRYYERIGLLQPVERINGQRRYDRTSISRLAVIQGARRAGLTLAEIAELVSGLGPGGSPGRRWRELQRCKCATLERCGEVLLRRVAQADLPPRVASFWSATDQS